MTALSANRNTADFGAGSVPAKSSGIILTGARIYKGALIGRNASGTLQPASADATLRIEGIAVDEPVPGAVAPANINLNLDWGAYYFKNSTGVDIIAADDIGKLCYAQDDQTVALTQGEGTGIRPLAGTIVGFDSSLGSPVAVLIGAPYQGARISKLEQVIEHSDLTAAAVSEAISLGTLPAGAYVLSHEIYIETLFSGASASAVVLDIGGTDPDAIVNGHDVFTGAATGRLIGSTLGVHPEGYFGGEAMEALFVATGDDVADLTAGKLTITIPYIIY